MVLSRLTKITGPGVATDTNWVGNNADFTGITTTATSFNIGVTTIHSNLIEAHNIKSTGIITATGGSFSGNVTAVDGTFTGNVSIAGTLTYEDVTNVDSIGIVTAAAVDVDDFVSVGSNIHLGNAGVVTATSFVGSGAALTGIDATSIKDSGGNVKIQAQASGAIHSGISTFSDDITFTGANYNVVWDKSTNRLKFDADAQLRFQDSSFRIYHDGSGTSFIRNTSTNLRITSDIFRVRKNNDSTHYINCGSNRVQLYESGNEKLATTSTGVNVTGNVVATGADINGDLDVDGHTNLDNVSIAGVTTMSGNLTISNTAPVIKLVDTDSNSDFSIYGSQGVFNIYDETNTGSRLTIASDGTITAVQGLVCSSTLTIPDSIIHSGDTDTKIRFPAADTISFETAGSEVLSMNLDGLVTGGQTNPTSSDNGNIYIKNGSSIGGVGHAVNYVSNAVFNGAWKYINSGTGATRIVVNQNGFQFDMAGSGTAGNNITFTEKMSVVTGGIEVTGDTQSTDFKYASHPGVASFTGNNSTTTMTIASGHNVNSVLVVYNGVVLTPTTDYTISGTTLTLQFTPPTNAQVIVRYLIK